MFNASNHMKQRHTHAAFGLPVGHLHKFGVTVGAEELDRKKSESK